MLSRCFRLRGHNHGSSEKHFIRYARLAFCDLTRVKANVFSKLTSRFPRSLFQENDSSRDSGWDSGWDSRWRATQFYCWSILRIEGAARKAASTKSSFLIDVGSWIRRAWTPNKSVGLKSSLDTTSGSIIARVRLMGAAGVLSRFLQGSPDEEKVLWAENTRILRRLQSSLTNARFLGFI